MYPDLAGKVAIVSGGATLIGQKVVEAFAAAGCHTVAADIDTAGGSALAARLGPEAVFQETDIRDDDAISHCIERAETMFGGLDFLVNVAAVYIDEGVATSRAQWHAALDVNLIGTAIFAQKAAAAMRRRGGGAIVNFASIAGKRAQPGRLVYSASKGAILQMTRSLALLLADDNIRVNAVSPGWTWSNVIRDLSGNDRSKADQVGGAFHLPGRIGEPEEVAAAVLFLCSQASAFVNGVDLPVDGGYCAIGPEGTEDAVTRLMA